QARVTNSCPNPPKSGLRPASAAEKVAGQAPGQLAGRDPAAFLFPRLVTVGPLIGTAVTLRLLTAGARGRRDPGTVSHRLLTAGARGRRYRGTVSHRLLTVGVCPFHRFDSKGSG